MADEPNWDKIAQMDPMVDAMQRAGTPLTRENYIREVYGNPGTPDYPQEWTAEHEAALPEPFQNRG